MNRSLILYESDNPVEIMNSIQNHLGAKGYNKCVVLHDGFSIDGYTEKDNIKIVGKNNINRDSLRGYKVQRLYVESSLYSKISIEDFYNTILTMLIRYSGGCEYKEVSVYTIDQYGNVIAKIYERKWD